MISFSRKNLIAAKAAAERNVARPPVRYDRRIVFVLLVLASTFILSHSALEGDFVPIAGQVADADIYAPEGFVFIDRLGAASKRREEFARQPEPYAYDAGGFNASAERLRSFFTGDGSDTQLAEVVIRDAARRPRVLKKVEAIIDRARLDGLLEKAYPERRMLSIIDRMGAERIVSSSEVMQPSDWERQLDGLTEEEMARVTGLLDKYLVPTLRYDVPRAEAILRGLSEQFPPASITFPADRPIILAGQELGERHVEILKQLGEYVHKRSYLLIVALLGFVTLTLSLATVYLKRTMVSLYDKVRDVTSVSFAFGLVLFLCHAISLVSPHFDLGSFHFSNAVLPAASLAILLTLLYDVRIAVVFGLMISVLVAVVISPRLVLLVMFLFGSIAGTLSASRIRRRSDLFRSGLWVAGVQAGVVLAVGVLQGEPFGAMRTDLISALCSGLFASLMAQALLLPLEHVSHRVSAFTLLELSDLNHSLLQQLLRKAPGTFQHSQHVALLAQSAAESIGANSLLTRVGAYFHDIGKMEKPEYFTENQGPDENPHDRLKPNLSATIIRNHVLDGIGLAEQERLPEPVIDFISQHHGTSTISIFYHRALEAAGEDEDVIRADFQYPGPKPQTLETGIVMLADAVEAATRGLSSPTAGRIERIVKRLIADIFESGQLDECELTLKDLTVISEEFIRVLCGMHHTRRAEYPDADEIEDAEKKKQ